MAVAMNADAGAVAFDLDMTLVDTRPASRIALERLAAEHGHDLDVEALMDSYGRPLSQWLPEGSDHALFRSLQMQDLASVEPMPGALAAVQAVRDTAGRVVVVTASTEAIALGTLRLVGLGADEVHADVWADGKSKPLREAGCWAFVGDHADDMSAARQVGAIAVGVATGTTPPVGADVELHDLNGFAPWLEEHLAAERRG